MRQKVLDIISDVCECEEVLVNGNIDLFESNILDSLAFIDMLTRFDDELDIIIQPTQVPMESFQSPNSIVSLVESLSKGE